MKAPASIMKEHLTGDSLSRESSWLPLLLWGQGSQGVLNYIQAGLEVRCSKVGWVLNEHLTARVDMLRAKRAFHLGVSCSCAFDDRYCSYCDAIVNVWFGLRISMNSRAISKQVSHLEHQMVSSPRAANGGLYSLSSSKGISGRRRNMNFGVTRHCPGTNRNLMHVCWRGHPKQTSEIICASSLGEKHLCNAVHFSPEQNNSPLPKVFIHCHYKPGFLFFE